MKHTIITCDLCDGRIYKDGYFRTEKGALCIRARQLERLERHTGHGIYRTYAEWKRRKYYICPKCVEKLKGYCRAEE